MKSSFLFVCFLGVLLYSEPANASCTVTLNAKPIWDAVLVSDQTPYLRADIICHLGESVASFYESDSQKSVSVLGSDGAYSYFSDGRRLNVINGSLQLLNLPPVWIGEHLYLPVCACAAWGDLSCVSSVGRVQMIRWSS